MNYDLDYLKHYASRRTPKDEITGLPKRYVSGLTPEEKRTQVKAINETKEHYKHTGEIMEREKINTDHKRSPFVVKFEKIYGFPITNIARVKQEFPQTDIDTIIKKGIGAYASSGSRPNQTSHSWAYARLASVLTGGKALAVDRNLIGKNDMSKILMNKNKRI